MKDNTRTNGKITLWTAQRMIVADTIRKKGVYHVKKEFIMEKYEESARVFLEAYNWFVNAAEKIVPRPKEAEYPIWVYTDLKDVECYGECCIFEIRASAEDVLLFDRGKWNRILNLSYIPKDRKDAQEYANILERQGIYDETEVYMKNYYPHLKAKVRKSWDRLFDSSICLSNTVQAALWEIKDEWIVSIT